MKNAAGGGSRGGWKRAEICINFEAPMALPIKVCVVCGQEFELKPDKPGFANRCPSCSAPEAAEETAARPMEAGGIKATSEVNAARRKAMRDLLYRKDS